MEVFLRGRSGLSSQGCFLHVRGGVSSYVMRGYNGTEFFPRPWRCFYTKVVDWFLDEVFSTFVEVFLQRLSE